MLGHRRIEPGESYYRSLIEVGTFAVDLARYGSADSIALSWNHESLRSASQSSGNHVFTFQRDVGRRDGSQSVMCD